MDRLRGRGTAEPAAVGAFAVDVGVPDLTEPLYARALVLQPDRSTATVEVEPPNREPFRTLLQSSTNPGSFTGLVMCWHVPVIIDVAEPGRVILVEPPCGPDLPLVPDEVQEIRDARDLRTSALLNTYPPPSAADLAHMMEPTSSAVHPAWDAVCYRLRLLSTVEADAVLEGTRGDGNGWERAEAALYSWRPSIPDDLRKQVGSYFMHLDHVAPQGPHIDHRPFWTLGVAALMRDLVPGEVDIAVFERVMRPFVEVCGPLPEQLLS